MLWPGQFSGAKGFKEPLCGAHSQRNKIDKIRVLRSEGLEIFFLYVDDRGSSFCRLARVPLPSVW